MTVQRQRIYAPSHPQTYSPTHTAHYPTHTTYLLSHAQCAQDLDTIRKFVEENFKVEVTVSEPAVKGFNWGDLELTCMLSPCFPVCDQKELVCNRDLPQG